MRKSGSKSGMSASQLISKRIADLGDWRSELLARLANSLRRLTQTSSRSGSGGVRPSGHTMGLSALARPTNSS